MVNRVKCYERTENLFFKDNKFKTPARLFFQFCKNITKAQNPVDIVASGTTTKSSPRASGNRSKHFWPCHKCQRQSSKESIDIITTSKYLKDNFEVVRLDFAEFKNRGEGL